MQSKQLGGYLWVFHKKKRRPTAAKYAALGGRVRAAISYAHCTAYTQRIGRVFAPDSWKCCVVSVLTGVCSISRRLASCCLAKW